MLLLIALFCISILIPIMIRREKQRRRVDAVLRDVKKWKKELKQLKKRAGHSDLDDEKIEMAENRLTFAKNAFTVKMKR